MGSLKAPRHYLQPGRLCWHGCAALFAKLSMIDRFIFVGSQKTTFKWNRVKHVVCQSHNSRRESLLYFVERYSNWFIVVPCQCHRQSTKSLLFWAFLRLLYNWDGPEVFVTYNETFLEIIILILPFLFCCKQRISCKDSSALSNKEVVYRGLVCHSFF